MNILDKKLDTKCPNCGADMLRSKYDDPNAADMNYTCPVCSLSKVLSYENNSASYGKIIGEANSDFRVFSYYTAVTQVI